MHQVNTLTFKKEFQIQMNVNLPIAKALVDQNMLLRLSKFNFKELPPLFHKIKVIINQSKNYLANSKIFQLKNLENLQNKESVSVLSLVKDQQTKSLDIAPDQN